MSSEIDFQRRFGGVGRLYGAAAQERFSRAHVCVIGLGGVGSWAAEALARSAIGELTLIDLDHIAESNINRQLHAVESNLGKAKVRAMAERILAINPTCRVHEIDNFITPENTADLMGAGYDVVLDAVDDAAAKVAVAAYCRAQRQALIVAGAAGGRLDPTRIRSADLANSSGDRLLAKVRYQLRRAHGFPRGERSRFGISCVYSDEPVRKPVAAGCATDVSASAITGLNCAGYGSSVCVTAPFGMAAAALTLNLLRPDAATDR